MSPTILYRIAAVLLILFATGHTVGFLKFQPPSPEALAVLDNMDHVQFQLGKSLFTYGGFYKGFGLFVTAYLLLGAFVAWHLGELARTSRQSIGVLGWAMFGVQVVSLILSWMYFPAPPITLSALLVICLGWAAWETSGPALSAQSG